MLKVLRTAFKRAEIHDPITSQVSDAKQANEAAFAKLQQTLCKVLDGDNCNCLTVAPSP